ncbi:MAG: hypothetical protein AAB353_07780 [Candidatus Hydrogenedentota bacterium]
MKGIRFLVDALGEKTAVVIDLKIHGELWEDMYDSLLAERRSQEPREPLSEVKKHLRRKGKVH